MRLYNREKDWLAALAFLSLFFVLVFFRIERIPGWPDELEIADSAIGIINGSSQYLSPLFFWPSLRIPSMVCFYTGSLSVYLQVPFLLLLGPSLIAARLGFILCMAAGLASIYYCASRFFGQAFGLLAALLSAVSTSMLFSVRLGGENEELLVVSLFWAGTAALLFSARHPARRKWAAAAGLLWGLALFTKFLMLGYLLGLALAWAAADRHTKALLRERVLVSARHTAALLAAFLFGAFPVFNAMFIHTHKNYNPFRGLLWMAGTFFAGNNDLGFAARAVDRAKDLPCLVNATTLYDVSHRHYMLDAALILAGICAVLAIYCAIREKTSGPLPPAVAAARALIAVYACVFLALCCVPNASVPNHIISLFPCLQLAAAFVISRAWRPAAGRRILLACLTAALLLCEGYNYVRYARYFEPMNVCSDARFINSVEMHNTIRENRFYPLVADISPLAYENVIMISWLLGRDATESRGRELTADADRACIGRRPQNGRYFYALVAEEENGASPLGAVEDMAAVRKIAVFPGQKGWAASYQLFRFRPETPAQMHRIRNSLSLGLHPVYNMPAPRLRPDGARPDAAAARRAAGLGIRLYPEQSA